MPGSYSPFARRAYALPPARGYKPPTPSKGGGDIIRSIFADGTDGFYFDFSKTDRLFQDAVGTLADGAGENIYVGLESHAWSGGTLATVLAAQTEIITPASGPYASAPTGVTGPNGTVTIESGAVRVTTPGGVACRLEVSFAATAGRYYKVTAALDSNFGIQPAAFVNATPASLSVLASGARTLDLIVYAPATGTLTLRLYPRSSTSGNQIAGDYVEMSSFSIKLIPGNHGLQATTAAQPKWQTGGLARFDGSDDNLLTTLIPGTAMTLLFKGIIPAASASLKVFMGAQESSTGRCHLYMNTSGNLACAAGDNSFNSAISIASTTCVIGAIFSGGQAYFCHNGSVTSAGAYTGDPTALRSLALGARNVNGSLDLFSNPDAAQFLAIKKALTAAEIAAITNKWGTS